jgi:hypothetical protein
LVLIGASAPFFLGDNRTTLRSARAGESLASTTSQAAGEAMQKQLRQLLLERKQLLEKRVEDMKVFVDAGRVSGSEYAKAREAALLAGLELCNTKAERIEIRREIVEIYKVAEAWAKRRADTGRATQSELDEAKVACLEAEINLLREKLG